MVLPLHDDNPTEIFPAVTIGIIVLCAVAFLWQLSAGQYGGERIIYALGVIPAVLLGGRELPPELAVVPPAASIFTSMFLHGGFLHLFGNMLYLWIFGNNVEDAMSHGRFIVFYLLCGMAAVFAQALPDPSSTVPMVGASGAISGVLGAYMLLYPHARVLLGLPLGFYIVQLGRFPAVWVLALWFAMQLLSNTFADDAAQGGVAFRAHIGGFIAGIVLLPLFKRRDARFWNPPR
jgi:membrane associated rhomboid family serine protease